MRNKAILFILTAIIMLFAAACGSNPSSTANQPNQSSEAAGNASAPETAQPASAELTIKHELGETTITKNPEKVVVFDFGVLDTLDKLGVEVAGVPKDSLPPYLAKYKDDKYAHVGGLKEPDFEAINKLGPNLIIISGRQADAYEELSKIAPTLYMGVDTKRYMASFAENVKTLGEIFGKEEVVEGELATVSDAIAKVKEKASSQDKKALIILASGGKISAYGPGSRFGIIHDELGVAPVDEKIEVSTHGQKISFEFIVEKDPDYLFVVDRDTVTGEGSSAKNVVENELVKNTKAFKNGKIVYLDPNYWYLSGGGLVSVQEMVKEIAAGIE